MSKNIHEMTSNQREDNFKKMAEFLSTFEESYQQLRLQRPANFNIYSLFDIEHDEVKHSSILSWFFDARASHYEGNLFLKSFVESCVLNFPDDLLDQYRVRNEFAGNESIVDIMIYRKGEFLIYLENKILSPEGIDQVDREFRDMQRLGSTLGINENRQFAIFLTPDGGKPISGDSTRWQSISYDQVSAAFTKCSPEIKSDKVKLILGDWLDTVSSF